MNGDEKPVFLCGIANGKLHLACCVCVITASKRHSVENMVIDIIMSLNI